MSSPTDGNEKRDDPSAYAPKWVRDSKTGHENLSIGQSEFPQHSEQSVPKDGLIRDQARAHRPLDTASLREARLASRTWRPPAGRELSEDDEQPSLPRSLDAQFLRDRPPARRALGRLAAVGGLAIAASIGAAIALFATGKLPSELNKLLALTTDKTAVVSKVSGDTSKAPEQMSSPAAQPAIASTVGRPISEDTARVASVRSATERVPAIRGVTDNEIRLGISAPFTGSAKELGNQMKLGIETAFNLINESGGIHGRQLRLVAADDGYEPMRAAETMKELYEKQQVFGFIGNVGTPTAVVALPYALERRTLFFGAFTGAGLLRRDPPDRYVFNYRASYAEETDATVRYLVDVRRISPGEIAVFAQQDGYGDAGFNGVAKMMRKYNRNPERVLRVGYKRNTGDVNDAVSTLLRSRHPVRALVMVATYKAAAKFIDKVKAERPDIVFSNVSFVGSQALADELMSYGGKVAEGVIVTQVVPLPQSKATAVLRYQELLPKYSLGEKPDFVSLEGYLAASLLIEGLKRAGRDFTTETLVDALEELRALDLGVGATMGFGMSEHQASHKVWGTVLDAGGNFQTIDMD